MFALVAKSVLTLFQIGVFAVVFASAWRIFTKAGRSGFALLIPIYNVLTFIRIAGKPSWWFFLLLIPGVNFLTMILLNISLAHRFGRGALYGLGLFFLSPLFYPLTAFSDLRYRKSA